MLKTIISEIIPKKKIKKVSLFIVGAQKSGTTALHNYLAQHPKVYGGKLKEINFFIQLDKFNKGEDWYHEQFGKIPCFNNLPIAIDASPKYMFDPKVAERIYKYNPDAYIIILLRNPILRAYSAWNMYRQFSLLSDERKNKLIKKYANSESSNQLDILINLNPFPKFEDLVNLEINDEKFGEFDFDIFRRGFYADQILPYLQLFGENVLIYEADYFKENKRLVTNEILNKCGLPKLLGKNDELKEVHAREYQDSLSVESYELLKKLYEPHNEKLFNLINQKFSW